MSVEFISVEELKQRMVDRGHVWSGEELDVFAAAVVRAERRRILDASLFQFGMGDGTYMMIRTSVVDPKESANGNS